MPDFPNVLLAVTAVINAGLIAFIYTRNRASWVNALFSLFVLFLAVWAVSILGFRLTSSDAFAILFLKLSYLSALLIAVCFYCFSVAFPESDRRFGTHVRVAIVAAMSLAVALLSPSFLTKEVIHHPWGKEVALGIPDYALFVIVFSALFVGGQVRLWLKYRVAKGLVRTQLLYIAASVTVIGAIGMYFNLLLPSPFLRDFRYVWTGPIFTAAFALIITYSIFRYRLFNAKAMVAELLVFALWLAMFVRTLFAASVGERLANALLLAVSIPIGILLIRSIAHEIHSKEELAAANAELSELSRTKSELLSIVSHQLRGPVAVIRGYVSMILEGDYGPVPAAMKPTIDRLAESGQTLSAGIDDYLNTSRIELGRVVYDFKVADFREVVERVVRDLRPAAKRKGLAISFTAADTEGYRARLDTGKMTEVVFNLLDNAIKYTPKGAIKVSLGRASDRSAHLKITDSGVGVDASTLPTLFQKFVRASDAGTVNAHGTGLGLYVAKTYVDAHGGRIWAESEGRGKGTTFSVSLPSLE